MSLSKSCWSRLVKIDSPYLRAGLSFNRASFQKNAPFRPHWNRPPFIEQVFEFDSKSLLRWSEFPRLLVTEPSSKGMVSFTTYNHHQNVEPVTKSPSSLLHFQCSAFVSRYWILYFQKVWLVLQKKKNWILTHIPKGMDSFTKKKLNFNTNTQTSKIFITLLNLRV